MRNSLEHYLDTADGAGRLMAHARLLIRLRRIYEEIAPSYLCQASTLANCKNETRQGGIVVIHAHSGAIAVKLRQIAPTLTEGFCKKGFECSEIRVKVQVPENNALLPHPRQKPLSVGARGALERLRESVGDDALRQSLTHLLERSATAE